MRTFTDYKNVDFMDSFEEDVSESLSRAFLKYSSNELPETNINKTHTAFFAFNPPRDEYEEEAMREMEDLLAPRIEALSKQSSASALKHTQTQELASRSIKQPSLEFNQTVKTRSSKKVTPVKPLNIIEKQMPTFTEPSPIPDPDAGGLHKRPPQAISASKGKSNTKKKGNSRSVSKDRSSKKTQHDQPVKEQVY